MRNKVLTTVLIGLLVLSGSVLFPAGNAQATWITIFVEHFTLPWLSWPWACWGGEWSVQPPYGYQWGIAPEITHYEFEPYQSIWCAAMYNNVQPSTLEPFVNAYPSNLNTKAIWGPFSLEDALEAECMLWYWVDTQVLIDYLLWGVSTDEYGNTIYEGGRASGPNANWTWATAIMDMSELTDPWGGTVSLLGYSPLWLVFQFYSDNTNEDFYGAFVDDITMGYDDGLFDLVAGAPTINDPEDSTTVTQAYEGGYYLLGLPWVCEGIGVTPPFNIDCIVDDSLFYSTRLTAEGGSSYNSYSDSLWTGDVGPHYARWTLDVDDEVIETYEDNNVGYMEFEVVQFDSAPFIEILRPTEGDTADEGFWIKWDAYDRESNAQIYLFYDDDSIGQSGIILNPGAPIYEDTDPDSFWWNTTNLPDESDYYAYGMITDLYNAPVYDYSDFPLHINHISSVHPGSGYNPQEFSLSPNFPNPFNAWTSIVYFNQEPALVELRVFDIEGRLVERLVSGEVSAGSHMVTWNADVSSGIYFCRIRMVGLNSDRVFSASQKMLLVR